jgi:uncharacterized protein (TIGR02145 family)
MEKERKFLHGFIKYTKDGRIVPGSLIITRNRPKDGVWEEIVIDLCCDDFTNANNQAKKAFVKFDTKGRIVPGSLVMGKEIPKPGIWKEVTVNLCCNTSPVLTFCNLPDVTIGTQTWTACNLNVTTYRNGDPIPYVEDFNVWDSLTTGAWTWINHDPILGAQYGKMYNAYAINDPRGLAPVGYHIPTNIEWETLLDYLGGPNLASTSDKLREVGISHWDANSNATNSSGFTALPGGFLYYENTFSYNDIAFFAGNADPSTNFQYVTWLQIYDTFQSSFNDNIFGAYVRLIKD